MASLAHDRALDQAELELVLAALADEDDSVRATALGALVRGVRSGDGSLSDHALGAWRVAMTDTAPVVRRRAAELAASLARRECVDALVVSLADADVTVVEAACWALGELGAARVRGTNAVQALAGVASDHRDALAREAAVAALGALGDEGGREAILRATEDRPAVRRRAVLALASYEGPDVDAALARALEDKDWQVRQAAEDLTRQ